VSDTAYDATSWNGVTDVAPSKNAVRDKIESLSSGGWTVTASKTGNYTAAANEFVPCDASGGAFTVTLPAATSGRVVTVKKTDSSTNGVSVAPASGTIDGAATATVYPQYASLEFIADGTNWHIR
jgi:Zn-dependent alcohol dehydrogenase